MPQLTKMSVRHLVLDWFGFKPTLVLFFDQHFRVQTRDFDFPDTNLRVDAIFSGGIKAAGRTWILDWTSIEKGEDFQPRPDTIITGMLTVFYHRESHRLKCKFTRGDGMRLLLNL